MISQAHARLIAETTGAEVLGAQGVSGGSIAQTQVLSLSSGQQVFTKTGAGDFVAEARGLRLLREPGVIRVPEVILAAEDLLVLEHIRTGRERPGFSQAFGRQLARLHRTTAPRFGLDHDNTCGATPQVNTPCDDWAEFYWDRRLRFQLALAERRGLASRTLSRAMARLEERLPELLAGTEAPPSLIHGDLWGGNYLVDEEGAAVLIDPAPYFGHREAELGMCLLFGGFDRDFFVGYEAEWPLPGGWRERVELYQLYHVLNHLNLFGRGYLGQAESIARRYG